MPRHSLLEYLDNFYRHGADIAAVHRRGYRRVQWSYQKIAETSCRFARELEARGIARGEHVLIWGENCAEWVVAFWGCLLRGAVVVPMDNIATPDFAARVSRQVDAGLLVCSRDRANPVPALPALALEDLEEAVSLRDRSPYPARFERADIAEIIFTSGTTAEPKGVVITHGNVLANLEPLETGINEYRGYERWVHPLRFLNLLPLSHVFGQFLGLFVPPLLAATVIFQDTLNPSEVARRIREERVSVLVAVPRLLESLKNKIERDLEAEGKLQRFRDAFQAASNERVWWRWWRFRRIHRRFGWKFWAFVSGGARLPAEIEAFWSRLGFAVVQGYGLTETTSLISLNHPFRLSKGSIGKVLPGREIKLDESGEILVRGESIAAGYWQGRRLQPVPGEGGWFYTGDLGELDEQGNLYFKGRKKNVIVTAEGMNVYPEDLESILRQQPEVRDAVVVGVARNGREEPCAVLLLRSRPEDSSAAGGGGQGADAIVERANRSLAAYQRMRCWFVWPAEDFPRTSTQKPRLNVIRETVAARPGDGQGMAPASPAGEPLADLIRRLTGHAPATLSPGARLETDLKLSSVDRVELMSAIEDRYQIDLNESRFSAATTLGDLERMLREPGSRRSDYAYPAWAQRWPVALIRSFIYYLLVWPATALMAYPRVRGRESLRGVRGPVLVICNHVTYIDIGFVLFALPPRFRHRLAIAMGGERLRELRHPPAEFGWWRRALYRLGYVLVVALFNVFPLPKQSGFRESFQFAGESADRGYSVLVFPEGELTPDGRIAPFRAGIGLLASKLRLPIVPVRIEGLFALKRAGKKLARPGQVKVTIGLAERFEAAADAARIAGELQSRVASLGSLSE